MRPAPAGALNLGAGLLIRGAGLLIRGAGLLIRGAGLLIRGAGLLIRGAGLLIRGALLTAPERGTPLNCLVPMLPLRDVCGLEKFRERETFGVPKVF